MELPLLMPMFEDQSTILGLRPDILGVLAGVLGAVLGLLLMRRMLTIEPEQRSFRSTERRDTILPMLVGALAVGFLAFAVIVAING